MFQWDTVAYLPRGLWSWITECMQHTLRSLGGRCYSKTALWISLWIRHNLLHSVWIPWTYKFPSTPCNAHIITVLSPSSPSFYDSGTWDAAKIPMPVACQSSLLWPYIAMKQVTPGETQLKYRAGDYDRHLELGAPFPYGGVMLLASAGLLLIYTRVTKWTQGLCLYQISCDGIGNRCGPVYTSTNLRSPCHSQLPSHRHPVHTWLATFSWTTALWSFPTQQSEVS